MKKILYILSILFATVMTACSGDDEPVNMAAEVAGTYLGSTNARCAYFANQIAESQTVILTANGIDKVNIAYTSDTWGTFSFDGVSIISGEGKYLLNGSGVACMGMGDNTKDYDCTFTGTVTGDHGAFTITCPSVMGGLTIEFTSDSKTK